MIKFYLLGAFQVLVDGRPLTGFVSNKVRALLAYLALESDRPHFRETLAALLWPEVPQNSAQGNLRNALSNLRRLLKSTGAELLSVTRQNVKFNGTDQVWVDVAVFQKLMENGRLETSSLPALEEAAVLYRGEFLEGLTVNDSAAFEEWCVVRREQFHRQILNVLHVMTELFIERGEYNQSLQYAWRGIELESWNEQACQQVMRALALSGQRDAALAQYERCCRLLKSELDVEPLPETTRLFEEIRSGKLTRAGGEKSDEEQMIPSNLPHPLTGFVGRQHELAEIERLIVDTPTSDSRTPIRLLTLIGAGGCGKTRLALESVLRLSTKDSFSNGIWWIDLAPLNDPLLVAQAVATVLGVREAADTPLITILSNYLRNKKMLLLLDNCEHLIDACAHFAETLLLACPQLKILATSREELDIDGERILRVNPLSLPDPDHWSSPEKLLESEAVKLFVDRADLVLPGFSLTFDNAPAVVQICRWLDGIPLALELAARQLRKCSPGEVAVQLEDRFGFLTNAGRTALPHHRTLRAVLDWSVDFLSEPERALFCELSVFSGGWTVEAAGQIANINTPDLFTSLVNKSLIGGTNAGRYSMLETIRQYGLEKLSRTGQEDSARSRHFDFFVHFAERSRKELRSGDQKLWMEQVQVEHDNIRSALEWSLISAGMAESGLRLAVAMSEFWNRSGFYIEERRWLERGLELTGDACSPRLRGWANIKLAYCSFCLGDFATMQTCLDVAWEVVCKLEDPEGMALVLQGRAAVAGEQNYDLEMARAYLEESLQISKSLDDKWEMAETLGNLGYVFYLQRDFKKARTYLDDSLLLCRETANKMKLCQTLNQLGLVSYRENDLPSARSYFEESRQIAKEMGDRDSEMDVLSSLGELARAEQKFPLAQTFYEEGLFLAKELGAEYGIAAFQQGLGYVALHFGDSRHASEYLEESLRYWQKQNMRQRMAGNLAGLAGVAILVGEVETAAKVLGKTAALMQDAGSWLLPPNQLDYEHSVSMARDQLGEKEYQDLYAEGYSMTLEQVIHSVTSNLGDHPFSEP